ncbi:MAG: SH3 domain-containing protein, partial [Clostridia bacterium]|nr:SH3 domain-containing protein [Clostridia bacterium]
GDFVGYIYLGVGNEYNTSGLTTTRATTSFWNRFRPTTTTTTRTTTTTTRYQSTTRNQTLPNVSSTTSGMITTTPAPGTDAYTTGTYVVNTGSSNLNMRSTPGGDSIVGAVPGNTRINVTQVNGDWGRITYNGTSGWVSLDWCVKQ